MFVAHLHNKQLTGLVVGQRFGWHGDLATSSVGVLVPVILSFPRAELAHDHDAPSSGKKN